MRISAVNPWSWYPLVASNDLPAGAVMPAMLHGERLVVWRSRDGKLGVWNDRCPHRSMSLSLGATSGEMLICPYHGWEFGSDGNCRRIPAHPALTPSRAARARVYPAIETADYVWACLGEPAAAQPECALIDAAAVQPVRSMHVRVDAETASLILLCYPPGISTDAAVAWRLDGDDLIVTHDGAAGQMVCRMRLGAPSVVVCRPESGSPIAAFVQPTGEATAAIHLATLGAATPAQKLALNSALVAMRQRLPALATSEMVTRLREACGESALPI